MIKNWKRFRYCFETGVQEEIKWTFGLAYHNLICTPAHSQSDCTVYLMCFLLWHWFHAISKLDSEKNHIKIEAAVWIRETIRLILVGITTGLTRLWHVWQGYRGQRWLIWRSGVKSEQARPKQTSDGQLVHNEFNRFVRHAARERQPVAMSLFGNLTSSRQFRISVTHFLTLFIVSTDCHGWAVLRNRLRDGKYGACNNQMHLLSPCEMSMKTRV